MKKFLFTLLISLCFLPGVNADTINDILYQDFYPLASVSNSPSSCFPSAFYWNDFETFMADSNNREIFNILYDDIMTYYEETYKNDFPYYAVSVNLISSSSKEFLPLQIRLDILAYDNPNRNGYIGESGVNFNSRYYMGTYYDPTDEDGYTACDKTNPHNYSFLPFEDTYYTPLALFETNYNFLITDPNTTYNITNKDGTLSTYKSLIDYYPAYMPNGYDPLVYDTYKEVNLDDYEYVILSLKDYNQKEAFSSNLQVKGMLGITPVYEFGTTEKTDITDRCNISYSDFTDHRLYILKNDLTNNAVYYVKACEERSSFRFDTSIFDITYVTAETVDDPVITVGGQEYHTIPFKDLSNSANENEENNFIPGQTSNSLSGVIQNATDYISDIWNSVTSFMSLVTKFFNTLPGEIRGLTIIGFTTLITIAIIKFIRG